MTRWLTEHEQELWRGWIAASMLLPDRLSRDLQEQHDLTGTDYQILVELSESPDRRMRMSTLADHTLLSRSRLSHQIDRMSKAGLVERQTCPDDGRGMYAALTERRVADHRRRRAGPRRERADRTCSTSSPPRSSRRSVRPA